MTMEERIARINELYHISEERALTEEESKERQLLRQEYIASIRANLRGQLNNISIQNEDGSIENLGEKHGGNITH